jgi:hypothetical protein
VLSIRLLSPDTAPSDTTRADEIAIETVKTGKVTAVVVVFKFPGWT